jgi:eukaryotic-like serine/threonine-protein kinase
MHTSEIVHNAARRMDSARWERVQALFHDAVDLPPVERLALLRTACGDDAALMSEVLAAIAEDERGSSLLDRGLAQTADRILGNDSEALREIGPYRILRVIGAVLSRSDCDLHRDTG